MNKRRFLSLTLGGTFLLVLADAALSAPPAPRYTVTDLETLPGGGSSQSWATAINDAGQVVGSSTGWAAGVSTTHAFLWENGKMRDIDTLFAQGKAQGPRARAINGRGDVVGDVWPQLTGPDPYAESPPSTKYQASSILVWEAGWLWHKGAMQIIGAPALAINDKGQVILGGITSRHGQIWRGGKTKDVPPVPGYQSVTILALNNRGDVAGCCANGPADDHAFVRLHGKTWLLGNLAGQNTSRATAVNDAGQVIGTSRDEIYRKDGNETTSGTRSSRAFFWQDGKMTDLGDRDVSGLGEQGQVVGSYFGSRATAFLWQNGQFVDLDTLIGSGTGWKLEEANAINGRGQIVGTGSHNGKYHAFLLTPLAPRG